MRLEPNGHLNVFRLLDGYNESLYIDLLKDKRQHNDSAYPTVCGEYGVCSSKGQCTCADKVGGNPGFFKLVNATQSNFGCEIVTPLSCKDKQLHTFMKLENVTYFKFSPTLKNTGVGKCKRECLKSCSCRAVVFRYEDNISRGNCYLPRRMFSLMASAKEDTGYTALTFVKIQRQKSSHRRSPSLDSILVPHPSCFPAIHYFPYWSILLLPSVEEEALHRG